MRALLIVCVSLVLSCPLFGQELSKEDSKIAKRLHSKVETVMVEVKDQSGQLLYNNLPKDIEFTGSATAYAGKEALLEEHAISTLFPLKNVGQVADGENTKLVYFPQMLVRFDAAMGKPRAAINFVVPDGAKLNSISNFNSEDGPLVMMEFLLAESKSYSYAVISEAHLNKLMTRLAANDIGVMTDARDNSQYKWAKIGDQTWLAENLKYAAPEKSYQGLMAAYKKSEAELHATYSVQPAPSNPKYEAWSKMYRHGKEFYYEAQFVGNRNRDVPYSTYYGRYYKFYDALSSCPKGWHIPSDGEWKAMEKTIGVEESQLNMMGMVSRAADGTKPGKDMIYDPDLMFNGRYAGSLKRVRQDVELTAKGENGVYWTSSKSDEVNALMRVIGTQFDGIVRDVSGTENYLSCRCVKDESMETITNRSPRLKELTAAITSSPSDAANYFDRSAEFLLAGESRLALNDINKAIELDGTNAEQKLFKAQVLYLYNYEQNRVEISALLDAYLAEKQDNDFAHYLYSKTLLYDYDSGAFVATTNMKRRQNAVDAIDKALKVDPKNPHYLSYRAKLLVVSGDYESGVAALKKELESDSKNGETHYLLAKVKLKHYDQKNKASGAKAGNWCTQITGLCYKLTPTQIKDACASFSKAINYGTEVSPDYLTICAELKQAELVEKYKPIIYTGPRGGRYTINSNGNKCYIPRNR